MALQLADECDEPSAAIRQLLELGYALDALINGTNALIQSQALNEDARYLLKYVRQYLEEARTSLVNVFNAETPPDGDAEP